MIKEFTGVRWTPILAMACAMATLALGSPVIGSSVVSAANVNSKTRLQAQPILDVASGVCSTKNSTVHGPVSRVSIELSAPSESSNAGQTAELCLALGRNVLGKGSIKRVVADKSVESGNSAATAEPVAAIDIWLTTAGMSALKDLAKQCRSSDKNCPRSFGTGSYVLTYQNQSLAYPIPGTSTLSFNPLKLADVPSYLATQLERLYR